MGVAPAGVIRVRRPRRGDDDGRDAPAVRGTRQSPVIRGDDGNGRAGLPFLSVPTCPSGGAVGRRGVASTGRTDTGRRGGLIAAGGVRAHAPVKSALPPAAVRMHAPGSGSGCCCAADHRADGDAGALDVMITAWMSVGRRPRLRTEGASEKALGSMASGAAIVGLGLLIVPSAVPYANSLAHTPTSNDKNPRAESRQ